MEPIRKRFDADPEFPFSFVYRDTKTQQRELPDHLHDWYELIYVHRGTGTMFIDGALFELRPGSLFAIPGNTIHRTLPDKDDPATSSAMYFSPLLIQQASLGEPFAYLDLFDQGRVGRRYMRTCPEALRAECESLLRDIDDELRAAAFGCRHAVLLLVHRLLLAVQRGTLNEMRHPGPELASVPEWMQSLLDYIDRHFAEPIGLAELSAQAVVSPAHFSRLFKRLTGMNVTSYLTAKRMIRAKELLLSTDDSVGNIAAACGFESMTHFHRTFKRLVGLTPAAYRRSET